MLLKQEFKELKAGTIGLLCQDSGNDESLLVQVYNISINKNDKLTCFLSDGHFCVKAYFKEKEKLRPRQHENAIINIRQHMTGNAGKTIGVVDFDLVCEYKKMIDNPQPFNEVANIPSDLKPISINPEDIGRQYISMEEKVQALTESFNKSIKVEEKSMKKQEKREMRIPDAKPLNGSVKDYESIKGLFIGIKNWHLLCRIAKMDYSEFKKKNSDKMVRMLTIELIDRSDVKISGYFFYEAADKFKDILKPNSVYKISQGNIANESYNNSKNDKLSPFKLMFHTGSVFEEVSDVNIIAKSQDSAIPLGLLIQKDVYDQEFDVLGILVDIEGPKEINKDGKNLLLWNWVVADPLEQKKIHAVLWNDKIKPDPSLIGKTIILSRFILHNYNGSLTLNSKARSSIQVATSCPTFQQMQEQAVNDHKLYTLLSERKVKEEQVEGTIFKNLKELNAAMDNFIEGESLKTDLDVFVNRLMMKKWYYEGCPSCNRAAEKGMSCTHCSKYVEKTVPHFILTVEFSDAFGSIYSTAYDEQAKKIFWEEEGVIHKMMSYDEKQLKDVVEDYYFQQFKVRIYTKKDHEGRIKHNMGRLESVAPEKMAMDNVEKIREMMGSFGM